VQRTIRVKLAVDSGQEKLLADTLAASRECFNAVARYGWDNGIKNGVELHKATYYDLRAQHPALPAQLVISARMKATEALRSAFVLQRKGKRVSAPQAILGSVRYDARSYRVDLAKGIVSLATTEGRIVVPFYTHEQARKRISSAAGVDTADLVRYESGWHLHIVLSIEKPAFVANSNVVGVDLGINRPAVTSGGLFLGKRRWKETNQRYFRLIRRLQAKGTKSAKRHLKKVRHVRERFRRDCDHVLSKKIVQSVSPGSVIVLENLTEIRSHTKQRGRKQRRRHHSWSYAQLRAFVEYKAEDAGCKVKVVDPRHTSQRCGRCAYTHRGNRKTQSTFKCRECGYTVNADLNAARNIACKYLVESGMTGFGGRTVNAPIAAEHGTTHVLAASSGL